MAEVLFVGGPWNGKRRPITSVGQSDGAGGAYFLAEVGMEKFALHSSINFDMAVAALLANYHPHCEVDPVERLTRISRLIEKRVAEAVASEREACAKVADAMVDNTCETIIANEIGATIRARETPSDQPIIRGGEE